YYVEIDTNADAHYNATGLQRVHRRGVELSPLTDSAAGERVIGAAKDDPKMALAPGIQWKEGDEWIGLADFHRAEPPPRPNPGTTQPAPPPQRVVKEAVLHIAQSSADEAAFSLEYRLAGTCAPDAPLLCTYQVSQNGVIF